MLADGELRKNWGLTIQCFGCVLDKNRDELPWRQRERGKLSYAWLFFFLLQFLFFFALKCVLQQAEGAAAEMRVGREPRRVEEYSVSLEHVSLWNSIIVFAESQIAHLPEGTAVIYLHVSESPLLDMSTPSVSSVMQRYQHNSATLQSVWGDPSLHCST